MPRVSFYIVNESLELCYLNGQPAYPYFLNVTGCERKIDLLLIEIFKRLFNLHRNGHLESGGLPFFQLKLVFITYSTEA